nr:MAG TPA: Cro/C1-type HTH DNA-binding domain protein [Caudoviricetes sp.]
MIIYEKLAKILKDRNMQWKDLCEGGLSINTPAKFSHNRTMNTENIDKVCSFLQVQPSEIMEWIPDEEYQKQQDQKTNAEKLAIEAQIAELQAKLKQM